jgi:hypothetical protein
VQPGQSAVTQHLIGGLVDGGERHGDTRGPGEVDQRLEVVLVVTVGAVLVLDLHEDHGATPVDLAGHHGGQHGVEVVRYRGEVARLTAAHPDPFVVEQPGGQPAVVPLGADERPGAHDGVHPLRSDEVEEPTEVESPVQ